MLCSRIHLEKALGKPRRERAGRAGAAAARAREPRPGRAGARCAAAPAPARAGRDSGTGNGPGGQQRLGGCRDVRAQASAGTELRPRH